MPELDPYLIDTLLPDLVGHDRRPSAYLLYLVLWRRARAEGGEPREVPLSLRTLTEVTGLSRRAVQDALEHLARRRLVTSTRETTTAIGRFRVHEPWLDWQRRARAGSSA
jgi:hypothetical protein